MPPSKREQPEGEPGRAERDQEGKEPQRRAEDEEEDDRHHDHRGGEEDHDLAAERVGETLDDHRHAGDVVGAVPERERVLADRRPDQRRSPRGGCPRRCRRRGGSRSGRRDRRGTGSRTSTSAAPPDGSGRRRSRRRTGRCRPRGPADTVVGLSPVSRNCWTACCCSWRRAPWSACSWVAITLLDCAAASLMNVAGPKTTRVAPRSAMSWQTGAANWPLASGLPARHVSSASNLSISLVSISFLRSPSARITIASSPNRSRNSLVPSKAEEPLSTSLSVPASGERRRAPTTVTIATSETTPAIVAAGWVTDHSPMRPIRRPRRLSSSSSSAYGPGAASPLASSIRVVAASPDQSMARGPTTSAFRNWRTKSLSELNSSSEGPLSTIRPFQRTAMKSAMRRAVPRSWLITM